MSPGQCGAGTLACRLDTRVETFRVATEAAARGFRVMWLLWFASAAHAAAAGGRLEGTVRDPSQSVMPGVLVSCMQDETGFRFTVFTNGRGEFRLTVPAGHYMLVASRSGFRAMERMNVRVPADGATRVDFELQPSVRAEAITVADSAVSGPIAEEDGAAVLTRAGFAGLPQNDRTVTGMLVLVPGMLITPANGGEPGQVSSLGARSNANSYTVDGVSGNNSVSNGGWPSFLPGGRLPAMTALGTTHNLALFDEVEEVRLQPHSLDLEGAGSPGGTIAIRTRSGTNQWHGSAFAANRPTPAAAADWFANSYGAYHIPRNGSSMEDEGMSLGGPLQRDRTFFFYSAERLDLRQAYTWATTVPSITARLLAPISLMPFLNQFPLPNGPGTASFGISELVGSSLRPASLTAGSLRIDSAVTPSTRAFLRFAYTPSRNETGFSQVDLSRYRYGLAVLGLTHYGRSWIHDTRLSFGGTEAASTWSTNGSAMSAGDFFSQFPSFAADFASVSVGGAGSIAVGEDGRNRQDQFQVSHSASWQGVRHQARIGFSYLGLAPRRDGADADLTVAFSSPGELFTNQAAPIWITYSKIAARSVRIDQPSGFAQDSWRIHPRLTLSFGLRWIAAPAPHMPGGPNLYSVEETGGVVRAFTSTAAPMPLWHGFPLHLDPSASGALRLTANTVLRASFTTVHDANFAVATDPLNGTPYLLMTILGTGPLLPGSTLSQVPLGSGYASNLKLPIYRRWDVALQKNWKQRDWISLSYSGMSSIGLLRRETLLNPTPDLGELMFAGNDGVSRYDGLQAVYKRSLTRGLQATVAASWSHSVDDGSSESALFQLAAMRSPRDDRGASDFDVRHTVNIAAVYSPHWPFRRLGRVYNGWTFGSSLYARTAFPLDVMVSETTSGFVIANQRPNLLYGNPLWTDDPKIPGGRKLNPRAFSVTVPGGFGNLGRMPFADWACGRPTRPLPASSASAKRCSSLYARRLLICSTIHSSVIP